MNKRTIGILLITGSLITVIMNRFTAVLSHSIGKLFCGDSYMQPVNGVLGDASCGFNTDMYIVVLSFIILIIGGTLVFTTLCNNKEQ